MWACGYRNLPKRHGTARVDGLGNVLVVVDHNDKSAENVRTFEKPSHPGFPWAYVRVLPRSRIYVNAYLGVSFRYRT